MKSITLILLFLGLISLSLAAPSAFLDDLFTPTIHTANTALVSCNATDTCAGKGDTCSGSYLLGDGCSRTNGTCCAIGLYCVNSTCVTDTYEGACSATVPCLPPNEFACINSTCQYMYGIGEPCTANAECYTGNCNTNTSMCVGMGYNQPCSISSNGMSNCNVGLYCAFGINSTCQNTTSPGAVCEGQTCSPGNLCYASSWANNTMTCQAIGTQQAGLPCAAYGVADACASGLVCNTGSKNVSCISVTTSSVACTDSSNCTNGASCDCSSVTGTSYCDGAGYNNPCTSEAINYAQCLAQQACSMSSAAPDSCAQKNCESEYKKYQSCGCSLADSVFGKCTYNSYCGGFPVWAIIVIIVVAIVLVLAIVLLVFFMMRRRRQYDSI